LHLARTTITRERLALTAISERFMSNVSFRNSGSEGSARAGGVTYLKRYWKHRELLAELVRRDVNEAYKGSMLASFWAVLHPILLCGLYLFVFGFVFVARLGVELPKEPDFAVMLLCGLASWLAVQAALTKSASSLVASSNLVKQVVFPVELLPARSALAAQLPLLIGIGLVALYSLVRFGVISPMLPLVLYVVAAQVLMLIGFALFASVLTVFLRDVRDVVLFFTSFGLFLAPVIYVPGSLPLWFNYVLYANPFSYAIWCLQDIFYFQSFHHSWAWLIVGILAVTIFDLGCRFFERTRHNLGDAL
jgi:lipopolysaccharide transport system permease protein